MRSRELAERRTQAAPENPHAFQAFSRQVFADGGCRRRPSS
jgi:hypothetical protein